MSDLPKATIVTQEGAPDRLFLDGTELNVPVLGPIWWDAKWDQEYVELKILVSEVSIRKNG